ncbi:MbtH family NRPS accessory protein [Umezawaea sp. Da 62-37]|uniref:MbtH family protein n=1 Tax=Umezawaea sp. Da 62-37 TaxID=3075927 RepID=UPI0028F6E9C8|nr:MbtH family NRPS accessory protein [Umezawaea sp. Da 62-37]WNV88922.1 MbtH family NRPS accessory protein [Umezawaea sp. Da 62-37]
MTGARRYAVILNHEEQYTLWPEGGPIPHGWQPTGFRGTQEECLAHIDEVWTDMRPRSLRLHMDEQIR